MNIDAAQKITQTQNNQLQTTTVQKDTNANFADELKTLDAQNESNEQAIQKEQVEAAEQVETQIIAKEEITEEETEEDTVKEQNRIVADLENSNTQEAIDGLEGIVEEMAQVNFSDENNSKRLKNEPIFDEKYTKDDKNEDNDLIDNNMNIQEQKEIVLPEMSSNMSFNSNGQPFSEFINPENNKQTLKTSAKDLAEEKAILSTMEENIAIANKNMALKDSPKTKTVTNEEGIKKVDTKTNITVDTIASFDTVIMTKEDVEFFANLINGDILNMSEIQNPEKSAAVSKTLADLLVKSMEDNKPIRINFDNDISVIIRIDREGKISADFLPSSQIAEAYLKENLPILRQRFDDNNIEYNELNQRKQKQDNDSQNRKKGRKDE